MVFEVERRGGASGGIFGGERGRGFRLRFGGRSRRPIDDAKDATDAEVSEVDSRR